MSWTSASSRRKPPFLADFDTPDGAYRDTVLALEYRERMCEQMTKHARLQGLDANLPMVQRHYKWFLRWYEGIIATGYLMGRTGVQRMTPEQIREGK